METFQLLFEPQIVSFVFECWIGAAIAAGASLLGGAAKLFSKRKQERRALSHEQSVWEHNSPAQQVARFKEAGINPYSQQYSGVDDSTYDPSMFDYSEGIGDISNSAQAGLNALYQGIREKDAHDLAEQNKEMNGESLFSQKTLNAVLKYQLGLDLAGKDIANQSAQQDLEAKKIDNEYREKEHKANLAEKNANIVTKNIYNQKYGELLQYELKLKDFQVKQFEQAVELNKATVLANQERYNQLIKNPEKLYRIVNNQLKYDEKASFYTLESHRIQHTLDLMSESLSPQTFQAMQAQLAYTIAQANSGTSDLNFGNKDWMRWTNFVFDKFGQAGNIVTSFGHLGFMRGLFNGPRPQPIGYGNHSSQPTSRFGGLFGR